MVVGYILEVNDAKSPFCISRDILRLEVIMHNANRMKALALIPYDVPISIICIGENRNKISAIRTVHVD